MLDYYADPANVVVKSDSGVGNMGDLDWPDAGNENARFHLDGVPFVVSFIRVHFSGTGASLADFGIHIDSGRGIRHDTRLHRVKKRGFNKDANWRVELDEIKDWILQANDVLVLTWTNPHAAAIAWGAEVGLVPVPVPVTNAAG